MYSYVLCSLHAVITIQIASAPFSFPTSFRKHARSPAHPRCLAEYPSRDVSTGGVSQRWSSVAHYNACRGARTYLRIMAIMLITVSGAVRARARAGVSSPRSGNGVCHYYGDRLTVNARYSFPPYARAGAPFPPWKGEARGRKRGGGGRSCSREEGRSNERTRESTLGSCTALHPPVFSGELPARDN